MPEVSQTSSSQHIFFIHLARALACIAVVAIHCVSVLPISIAQGLTASWWSLNIVISASIWAVPLFVMVSGALLLDKQESIIVFYRKRVEKIGVVAAIWIPFYFIFYHFYRGDSLTVFGIIQKVLHSTFDHLYFLILILELYFITPFLRVLLRKISTESFLFLIALFLFIGIFWTRSSFVLTMFVPYLGVYLGGSFLMKHGSTKLQLKWLALGIVTTILGIIMGNLVLTMRMGERYQQDMFLYYHLGVQVIILTSLVFLLLKQSTVESYLSKELQKKITQISNASLGIYILHPFVLLMTLQFIKGAFPMYVVTWFGLLALIPVVVCLSYVMTKVLRKISPVAIL